MSRHEDGTPMKFSDWVYESSLEEWKKLERYGWITREEIREEFILNPEWVKAQRPLLATGEVAW